MSSLHDLRVVSNQNPLKGTVSWGQSWVAWPSDSQPILTSLSPSTGPTVLHDDFKVKSVSSARGPWEWVLLLKHSMKVEKQRMFPTAKRGRVWSRESSSYNRRLPGHRAHQHLLDGPVGEVGFQAWGGEVLGDLLTFPLCPLLLFSSHVPTQGCCWFGVGKKWPSPVPQHIRQAISHKNQAPQLQTPDPLSH